MRRAAGRKPDSHPLTGKLPWGQRKDPRVENRDPEFPHLYWKRLGEECWPFEVLDGQQYCLIPCVPTPARMKLWRRLFREHD